jgi:hypothetical protein
MRARAGRRAASRIGRGTVRSGPVTPKISSDPNNPLRGVRTAENRVQHAASANQPIMAWGSRVFAGVVASIAITGTSSAPDQRMSIYVSPKLRRHEFASILDRLPRCVSTPLTHRRAVARAGGSYPSVRSGEKRACTQQVHHVQPLEAARYERLGITSSAMRPERRAATSDDKQRLGLFVRGLGTQRPSRCAA